MNSLIHRHRRQASSHIIDLRQNQIGALFFARPFSGISYTSLALVSPFKTLIRNYGAEIAT
ncbi:hypothetical protein [Pseudomonas sp. CHM02]|uniref:hypothetical protein n=1 Tax=Pseudomonas sp. CHM02 TaxID=1463662 RepID=UPI0012DF7E41|nr:hypothetical protein [Pseudomonas sp. CHM02]